MAVRGMAWAWLIRSDVWTGLAWTGEMYAIGPSRRLLHTTTTTTTTSSLTVGQIMSKVCLRLAGQYIHGFPAPTSFTASWIAWISMDSVFLGEIISARLLLLIGSPVWNRN